MRRGNRVSGYISPDGVSWKLLDAANITNLPATIYVGFTIANHGASRAAEATFSDFSAAPLTADELIPATHLTSFSPDPLDTNGDNLPDAWQSQFALAGTAFERSEFGDPDGDGITNLEESQLGTELWLSTDGTKYRKKRIAQMGAVVGTGTACLQVVSPLGIHIPHS